MGEIGWAFIGGKVAGGTKGAVQWNDGDTWITGSDNFKYVQETNTVVVSSSVFVSGTLYANDYHVNVVNETVTNLSSQGSSIFGNTSDDVHQFTGSVSINGNFELVGSPDSDLIYELSGTYYSASNGNVPHEATFDRAISPAMVVSGAAVFNDPVSIQGGLYGASPIQVYAPLSFTSIDNPNKFHSIEPGKITGDLVISSSVADHGLFLEGAGIFQMRSRLDSPDTFLPELKMYNNNPGINSYPMIDFRKFEDISVDKHPNMLTREHYEYNISTVVSKTEIPVFVGDDQNNLNDYTLETLKVAQTKTSVDIRRNTYKMEFGIAHTEFDPTYEQEFANSGSSIGDDAKLHPFTTSGYDHPDRTIKVMELGTFGDVGESNKWGIRRGIKLAGNLMPESIDGELQEQQGIPYPSFSTKDLTIGNATARWGDLYLSNDRKVSWGENRDSKDWYLDSQEQHSASLGYETLFDALVVDGARLKVNNNLEINSNGYVNFNQIQGEDGYGFRDLNGQIQFKNQSGEWSDFQSIFGGSSGGNGAIQISDGNGNFTSSPNLSFENDTLIVSGTIVANEIRVNTIDQTVTNISMTGSTSFGDTQDDTHGFIGSMSISGSLSLKRKVVTNNYTLELTDHFIAVDSATNITIQLPLASELNDGQFFTIKDENGGENKQIILQCSGSDEIDGEASISLTSPYTAINFYSNGQNKFFIF